MIVLYAYGCTPCRNKAMWKAVKDKAKELKVVLSRKDVSKDIKARYDAQEKYGMPVPFILLESGMAVTVESFLNA